MVFIGVLLGQEESAFWRFVGTPTFLRSDGSLLEDE
jgi:hypothetical protein